MAISTVELGDFRVFGLLQFTVALPVFVQQPAVVIALHLVLLLQVVVLPLQVVVLILTQTEGEGGLDSSVLVGELRVVLTFNI